MSEWASARVCVCSPLFLMNFWQNMSFCVSYQKIEIKIHTHCSRLIIASHKHIHPLIDREIRTKKIWNLNFFLSNMKEPFKWRRIIQDSLVSQLSQWYAKIDLTCKSPSETNRTNGFDSMCVCVCVHSCGVSDALLKDTTVLNFVFSC